MIATGLRGESVIEGRNVALTPRFVTVAPATQPMGALDRRGGAGAAQPAAAADERRGRNELIEMIANAARR